MVANTGVPVVPLARFIHERGPRWEAPFVVADCASASPDSAIGLLFGCEQDRCIGWLRSALHGTLLLRDLPSLPRPAQAELAAVLSRPPRAAAEVRVIATARMPLEELRTRDAVDPGLFDLLSANSLVVPALRNRREDLPSLVLLSIDRACRVLAVDPVGIEREAMGALVQHDWPGDVAELALLIELAVGRAEGRTIRLKDLPRLTPNATIEGSDPFSGTYAEIERRLLEHALCRAGGNKSEAARMLGLKRTTFLDKLRRYDLEAKRPESVGGSAVG
jgi:DNA-binding NtrC family response regulator